MIKPEPGLRSFVFRTGIAFALLLTGLACSAPQGAATGSALAADGYDLVILNGRVMDPESGLDATRNVGIQDGKIAAITERTIAGAERIDAAGHVVSPGFIDGHVHVIDMPLGQRLILRDGVTTSLELEVGALPVGKWYESMEGKSHTNYGISVSMIGARAAVFDPAYLDATPTGSTIQDMFAGQVELPPDAWSRIPTAAETDEILALIDEGLSEGALSVGPPAGYMVAGFTSQEMIGAQQLAGKYGRFVHLHARFSSQTPPTSGILSFQEAIASAGTFGGGLILAHFTAQSLADTQATMDYVAALQANGVPIMLEVYPYNFGGAGNGIQADYLEPHNYQKNMGRTYSDIIDVATGKPLDKETYDELLKTDPTHTVLFYNATEEDNLKAVANPDVLIGCDCFPMSTAEGFTEDWDTPFEEILGHPRTAGAHAKVLRLSREGHLPLMSAISKMSYQWARFLEDNGAAQMATKGRLQEGMDADITIFDPATVTDNSSLEQGKNALPSTGIPYVLVNGQIVVKDSVAQQGVYAGQPIRAEVTD